MKTAIIVALPWLVFVMEKFGPERMKEITKEDITTRLNEVWCNSKFRDRPGIINVDL